MPAASWLIVVAIVVVVGAFFGRIPMHLVAAYPRMLHRTYGAARLGMCRCCKTRAARGDSDFCASSCESDEEWSHI
jgi:hypothetical protein